MTVTATLVTPHASRYLQQLCKHFAHKVPATFDARHGEVTFQHGTCVLDAEGEALTMRCTADSLEHEPMLVKIVAVHLERFAWKEGVPELAWQRDGQPAEDLMAKLRAMPDPHGNKPD
jgi:hypothetical protein